MCSVNLKASKEKCAFWDTPFNSTIVCGSRSHLGWKETGRVTEHGEFQLRVAWRECGFGYICLKICNSPYEKVIIGGEGGIGICCCITSVQQHVEPLRTNVDFKCLYSLLYLVA